MKRYLDFDVLFRRVENGYRAQVLSSPAGQASCDFNTPFSELELENLLLRIGRPRRSTRRMQTTEINAVKTFGGKLFSSVFAAEVLACFRMSMERALAEDAGLRVRLRLTEVPELADLPWEYLYNAPLNRFVALSAETPVVRYLDLPERTLPLRVELPLRILVMVSSPSDYPALDAEGEWQRLKGALADLETARQVVVERLPDATLHGLQRRLRRESCHVFHFIGHGGFNEQSMDGLLLLEDPAGRADPVSSQYLGTLLHDHRPLRVAVLNACEGARAGRVDPYAGTAQSLVQQGIPAVIAMQFEITDRAALIFAHEFYLALADGCAVDMSLAEARKALYSQADDVEWGTPVLYMRASDGRIFDVESARLAEGVVPAKPTAEAPVIAKPAEQISPSDRPWKAPRVYISYTYHDIAAHKERVLQLSNALRGDGIEAHLDQYELGPASWKQWQAEQVRSADFVLIVCTKEYRRRVESEPESGVFADGELIQARLAADPSRAWLVPIGYGRFRENREGVPAFVGDSEYYNLTGHEDYERLVARLLGRPLVAAPPVAAPRARTELAHQVVAPKLESSTEEIRSAEADLNSLPEKNEPKRQEASPHPSIHLAEMREQAGMQGESTGAASQRDAQRQTERKRGWARIVVPLLLVITGALGYLQYQAGEKSRVRSEMEARRLAEEVERAARERESARQESPQISEATPGSKKTKGGVALRQSGANLDGPLPLTQTVAGDTYTLVSMEPPSGTVLRSGENRTIRYRVKYELTSQDRASLNLSIDQASNPYDKGCQDAEAVNASSVVISRGSGEVDISVVWTGGRSRPEESPHPSGYLAPSLSLWSPPGKPGSEQQFYATRAFRGACLRFAP
jgi:hypothetical protein